MSGTTCNHSALHATTKRQRLRTVGGESEMIEILVKSYRRDSADQVALIDDKDSELIESRAWRLSKGYAVTRVYCCKRNGRSHQRDVSMHRMIMGLTARDETEVDHINRDRLDNRRRNLRLATHAQNAQNVAARKRWNKSNISSIHRGVHWDSTHEMWKASAVLDGKLHALSYFHDENEAAEATVAWRREHMPYAIEVLGGAPSISTT